jgi:hypothetical protein
MSVLAIDVNEYSLEENSLRRVTSFQKFKKKELDEELEARSIEITDETKPKLVEHLNDILHSICRPTTFMLKSPTKSSKELYIDDYEILGSRDIGSNFQVHTNWYDSLFPLHKYNCNVLLVVDHTQIA